MVTAWLLLHESGSKSLDMGLEVAGWMCSLMYRTFLQRRGNGNGADGIGHPDLDEHDQQHASG